MIGQTVVPTYEDEASGIRLYRGDCLEVMKHLPIVDMVLTDPPYGTTQNKWDSVIPLDEMWERIGHISKKTTPVVLTAAQPFTSVLVMSNIRQFKYQWVWDKSKPTGHLNAKKQPLRSHEDVTVFYNKQCQYNPQGLSDCSNLVSRTNRGNYGECSKTTLQTKTGYPRSIQKFATATGTHPTQKPVSLMEYLIKTYTSEGDTVLDFTMGSGTTGVACINTGRKFIGIELDEGYFEIARNRIDEQISSNDTR